jgi:hypothetical protein
MVPARGDYRGPTGGESVVWTAVPLSVEFCHLAGEVHDTRSKRVAVGCGNAHELLLRRDLEDAVGTVSSFVHCALRPASENGQYVEGKSAVPEAAGDVRYIRKKASEVHQELERLAVANFERAELVDVLPSQKRQQIYQLDPQLV